MLDEIRSETEAAVRAAAEAYAHALHAADTGRLSELFHENSHLYLAQADGTLVDWPRQHFLDRVGARRPGNGEADFAIESIDVAGPEMACVRLSVAVPPRRYTDYLNFLRTGGRWRVIAKVFRVADGPAV